MSMVIRKNRDNATNTVIVEQIRGILPRRSLPKEYLESDGPIVFAHENELNEICDSVSYIDSDLPGFTIIVKNGNKRDGIQVKVGDEFTLERWNTIRDLVYKAGELLHKINQDRNYRTKGRCTDVI